MLSPAVPRFSPPKSTAQPDPAASVDPRPPSLREAPSSRSHGLHLPHRAATATPNPVPRYSHTLPARLRRVARLSPNETRPGPSPILAFARQGPQCPRPCLSSLSLPHRRYVTDRDRTREMPLVVPRDQRNHFLPPVVTTARCRRAAVGGVSNTNPGTLNTHYTISRYLSTPTTSSRVPSLPSRGARRRGDPIA